MDKSTESMYDAHSQDYDNAHCARKASEITAVEEIVVKSFLRRLEFTDVLDAATGTGRYALFLAEQGKRVEATDQSANMLAVARRKAEERGLHVRFRKEPVSEIGSPNSSTDLVLCMLALAHVQDLQAPMREFARILRPGGHLIISDLHPDIQACWGPDSTTEINGAEFPFPSYHSSTQEYEAAAVSAGLDVVAVVDVPMQQERGLFPGPFVMLAAKPEPG